MQTVFTPSLPVKGNPSKNRNWACFGKSRPSARKPFKLIVLTVCFTLALW